MDVVATKATSASAQTVWETCLLPMQWERWDESCKEITNAEGGLVPGGTFTYVSKAVHRQPIRMTVFTIIEFQPRRRILMSCAGSRWAITTTPQASGGCIMTQELTYTGCLGRYMMCCFKGKQVKRQLKVFCLDRLQQMVKIAEGGAAGAAIPVAVALEMPVVGAGGGRALLGTTRERLTELQGLVDEGLITKEEYATQREQIVRSV